MRQSSFFPDGTMSDDKTRVIPRGKPGKEHPAAGGAEPQLIDGQIVFFCPAGHRLVVPLSLAGKHGKCSKCSMPLQIPELGLPTDPPHEVVPSVSLPQVLPAEPPQRPDQPQSAADDGDWNFISGIGIPAGSEAALTMESDGDSLPASAGGHELNPMARLLTRLWAERDHGGIIELHLSGGAVLLPEEFSARWSGGSHGLFASQAADGSVTLTAVAWDTVQRIVVRHLAAVPDDMFE